MAKVFRFHNGSDAIEHWQDSQPYGKLAIDAIKDPEGATSKKEITSIPSPFARIDLVKAAFEFVANSNNPDGSTAHHKMVSDSLDVGEIFFNIDKHHDKVGIIVWDKETDLKALINSENTRHRQLGKTLEIFLKGDASANNFNDMHRLYLLNYKKGQNPINIIGGTSPASLFFTSANKFSVDIMFGKDMAFDDSYQPLYKRDFNYQKFIFGLQKFTPDFATKFSTVDQYLAMSFRLLSESQRDAIRDYKQEDFENEFERLTAGSAGSTVEVLGIPLRKKIKIQPKDSGFIIDTVKDCNNVPPLVLPVDDYAEKTIYVSDFWDSKNRVRTQDDRPLKDRTLPFDDTRYPYLTISDFLEPYMVRTVYPLYKDKFFDGNFSIASGDVGKGYLLPVKKEYFNYFDTDSLLTGRTQDGKHRLEIKQMHTGGVQVILRIPIQKGKYITYERTYYPPVNDYQVAEPDIDRNRGVIIENQFGLSIYPFFKVADADNHYRVALMDRDILEHTRHNKYSLRFFKSNENKHVIETAQRERSNKAQDNISSLYYVVESDFDYAELNNGLVNAIIIPKFDVITQGNAQFSFAVDFGTTNTHIEYKKGNEDPKPFEINEGDIQIASLYNIRDIETIKSINAIRANTLTDTLPHEFVPELINSKQEIHFPQRTAISSKKGISLNDILYALTDFNIPFLYEKHPTPNNAEIKTNLKWANISVNDIKIIEVYFENLLLLIRAKVLLNGGNLAATKLVWLYPSSMMESRRNKMGESWEKLFKKYFDTINPPKSLSESVAPFYYFNKKEGIAAGEHSAISIDIGGETTDVVVYLDDKPNLLTSFRFAANAVFGDFHGRSATINGFVNKYKNVLEEKGLGHRFSFRNIERSEDIISYLFSIEKSDGLKKDGKDFSFNKLLQADGDFRIVFLLFYSSIIYHIAKILDAKGIKAPAYVTLSGTGSKIVDLAEGSSSLTAITELTQLIFTKVLQREKPVKLEIKKVGNPKEISCIGALLRDENTASIDDVTVLSGTRNNDFSLKYKDITEETERDVILSYEGFIRFFFSMNNEFNYRNKFDLNPSLFSTYRMYLEEKSMDYLKTGLKEKQKELQDMQNSKIEETLFFYPLRGALNHLAYKIYTDIINTEK